MWQFGVFLDSIFSVWLIESCELLDGCVWHLVVDILSVNVWFLCLPSCVSISSTSLFCWLISFLLSCPVTWFILSPVWGGVWEAPVSFFATGPVYPLFFFTLDNLHFKLESVSLTTLFVLFVELFFILDAVVNLTKCLLAMRPISADF